MKKLFKKSLSVLLAVVMTFTITLPAFAQSEDNSGADAETDVSYDSTNAIGDMILDATQDGTGESAEYVIQSVDVEGKFARVDFINADACTIVVSIYDESGKIMLGSGKETIEAKESVSNDSVTVTIDIDEMPEYFLVKAFMLDENNAPLCHNYETKEYTQAFEEFLSKTTDDFDEDKTIMLDESGDNNFLVVSDDAIVIEAEDSVNIVTTDDYENGLYVIKNADSQIAGLKSGDIIYYQYGDLADEYILTTVGNIDIDGDTVTITAAESGELTDYFDYVKIDVNTTQTTFDGSEMDEDVTHEKEQIQTRTRGNTNIDGSASVADKWTVDKTFDNAIKLSASIEIKASMSLKIYVDKEFDYTYIEAVIKYSGKVTASLSGKIEFPPIPLGRIGFDTEKLGIVAAIKFDFVVEGKAAISLTFTLEEGAVGLAYSSDIGLIDKRQSPTTNFTPELKSELTIFIGVSITPEIQATKHMEISLEAKAGLEIKGTILNTENDELHYCSICIDGEAAFKLEATAAVRLFDWIENEWTLIEIEVKLGKFYVSFDNGWNFGACPNRAYKVTVVVYDKTTGKPVNDVTVNSKYTPDATGVTTLYLKNGTYTITVDHSTGNLYTNEITIYNAGKNIEFSVDFSSLDSGDSGDDNTGTDDPDPEKPDISEPDVEDPRTVTASGTCGDNLTWTLYDDGELVISGTGAMKNYSSVSSVPWYSYRKSIKSATIGMGVTTIGYYSFQYCDNLTSIILPESLTTISGYAFQYCSNLANITIPDGVTTIEDYVFGSCRSLTELTIPDSVTSIGSGAFSFCYGLTNITIPTSVTRIAFSVFEYCTNLKSIIIPESITTISSYAFQYCYNLTNITIPDSVTSIGDCAFGNCESLTNITIPDSVISIGSNTFYECYVLESITVDENNASYSSDEYGVLFNKNKTKLIQYPAGNSRTNYTIPDSVTSIGGSAFSMCNALTSITIPDSVTSIGGSAFKFCDSLTSITIPDGVTSIGGSAFYGTAYYNNESNWENGVLYIGKHLVCAKHDITECEIKNDTLTIVGDAFYNCDSLTSVTIGNGVTSIGDHAFYSCDALVSVTIGNSVTSIGSYAFYSCALISVIIPDRVTSIGSYAFKFCDSLTSVKIGDSVTRIGDSAFENCKSLTSITIPDSVTNIGGSAFSSCKALESVTIGNSVTSIGEYAFSSCNALESVTIGSSVTNIRYRVFYNCDAIETVYYTGTQEQWSKISINASNDSLINANIICSDTVSPAMFTLRSIFNEVAAYSPRAAVQSETVNNAVVGNSYVILVVKDKDAEDLLASENLLYIDQKIAESSTLTFEFDVNGATDFDVIITNAEFDHYHKYTAVTTAPTCTEQGYTTYTCYCGDTYTGEYVDAIGHTEEIIEGIPADCTNNGLTEEIICSVCDTVLTEYQIIPATGHTNEDDDNICDVCGYDFSQECSHNCHSSNAFLRFFWKIALFFNKLFNIESKRICECGVAHW